VDVHLWLVSFGPIGKQIGNQWAVGDMDLSSPMSLSPGMFRARPTQQAQRMEEGWVQATLRHDTWADAHS
jgi:hypothetical protein